MPKYSRNEFETMLLEPYELLMADEATEVSLNRKNESGLADLVISPPVRDKDYLYFSIGVRLGTGDTVKSQMKIAAYEVIYGVNSWQKDQFHRNKWKNPYGRDVKDFSQRHLVGDSDTIETDILEELISATQFIYIVDHPEFNSECSKLEEKYQDELKENPDAVVSIDTEDCQKLCYRLFIQKMLPLIEEMSED